MQISAGSLDANVLLRLLLDDIPEQHVASLKLFNNSVGQFDISDTAIIEVVFVLCRAYGFSRHEVSEAIDGIMQISKFNINRPMFEQSLKLFAKHSGLSFEDCCLSVYATLNAAEPLWTFDKKLSKQTANARLVN